MASDKTWFTKTIASETLATKVSDLLDRDEISEEAAIELNKLFASARSGGGATTTVRNSDGETVGKRCSYLKRYFPISEFGTIGKDDEGNVKYGYQSKEGAKLARKAKSKYEEAIATADEMLEKTEDIQAWKAAKAEAKAAYEAPVESELGYATAEELLASL